MPTRRLTWLIIPLFALLAGCPSNPPQKPPVNEPPKSKFEQMEEQATKGDAENQYQLGSTYFLGNPTQDLKQAEYWWKKAADQGHSTAAVGLAFLYSGRDDSSFANKTEMLRYLNQAVDAGNPMAQDILGNMYLSPTSAVSVNPDRGRALLKKACDQGYQKSCEKLGKL